MGFISGFKEGLEAWIKKVFKKRRAKIGIYGPPNAGKTTLANRILHDWNAGASFGTVSPIPHETRRAMRKEGVKINADGSSIELDIVDTPGMATKIDFREFMAHGLSETEAKRRAKEATEGVIEAIKWLDDLDGVLLVMDSTEDPYTQVNVTVIATWRPGNCRFSLWPIRWIYPMPLQPESGRPSRSMPWCQSRPWRDRI